jgi:hypothetical protein
MILYLLCYFLSYKNGLAPQENKNQLSNEIIIEKYNNKIKQQATRYVTCRCLPTSSVVLERYLFLEPEGGNKWKCHILCSLVCTPSVPKLLSLLIF